VFDALYNPQSYSDLPGLIDALDRGIGAYQLRRLLYIEFIGPHLSSEGMRLSVACSDLVPFNDVTRRDVSISTLHRQQMVDIYVRNEMFSLFRLPETCALWGITEEDVGANEPIVSDIPVLVMSGSFDPITPPEWSERVAHNLPNSYYYEFPTFGHGVTLQGCPIRIMGAFLENPDSEPDTDCMTHLDNPLE
jgi:pimeloyl-ACP methyl ester carboxylesterase